MYILGSKFIHKVTLYGWIFHLPVLSHPRDGQIIIYIILFPYINLIQGGLMHIGRIGWGYKISLNHKIEETK